MEGSRLSPRYVPPGHVAGPDPLWYVGSTTWEVWTDAGRPRTHMEGPSPRLLAWSFPSSGTHGVTGLIPRAGNGSGAVGLVR